MKYEVMGIGKRNGCKIMIKKSWNIKLRLNWIGKREIEKEGIDWKKIEEEKMIER